MLGTVMVVNVVLGGEAVIVDVDWVVGSRVVDEGPKAVIDICLKTLIWTY